MNLSTASSNHEQILRKIGEDPILRPFLSSLFDNETYINHIIQEKKSEECLSLIASSTELINEEIQRYITENQDILMSGMQDVASLANQYQALADHSKILQGTIFRLKREVAESYDVVNSKTQELERIHESNFLLNQLRQFVKTKSQLTQYLKNQDDKDTRSLAAAARTIAELEKLISNPKLVEIKMVGKSVPELRAFSNNIRLLSQTNLFQAIEEKNQLEIANFLQVFYNLESLPEINLLVVDHFVRKTIDATRDHLDFAYLQKLYHDHINKTGGAVTTSTSALSLSASKKSLSNLAGSNSTNTSNPTGAVTLAQLRIAMKEVGHIWSSMIYDRATQLMVFQRVLWKKEDPVSHEKFLSVLKQMKLSMAMTGGNDSSVTHQFLSQGQILSLFWYRLSVALQEVCYEKLKEYPAITNRAYLCLRKSLTETLQSIDYWQEEELQRNLGPAMKFMKALTQASDPQWRKKDLLDSNTGAMNDNHYGGMFGSLTWRNEDILSSSVILKQLGSPPPLVQKGDVLKYDQHLSSLSEKDGCKTSTAGMKGEGKDSGSASPTDHPLLVGLKPFHDRYLISVLERMNHPITQMFPELEGYTAAIPSKRDLQTFIKAIQNELIMILVEGDEQIIYSICKEFLKVNKLMLSKIQNMVIQSQESRIISGNTLPGSSNTSTGTGGGSTIPSNATTQCTNNFQRTNAQEHNLQLMVLLLQLKEALERIPLQMMKYLDENALLSSSAGSSSTASSSATPMKGKASGYLEEKGSSGISASATSTNRQNSLAMMMKEIEKTMTISIFHIHECMIRDLLSPIIDMISDYCLSVLAPLQKESILHLQPAANTTIGAKDPMQFESSFAVQSLMKQLPALLKTYLFCLPKNYSSILLDYAMEEITLRLIQGYLSIASLSKPFTEITKINITKDLTALEEVLSTYCSHFQSSFVQRSVVLEEWRSFRRYLFEESDAGIKLSAKDEKKTKAVNKVASLPPKISLVVGLDYVQAIRPSILIGYLIANAPNELPLPFEMMEKDFLHYLAIVLLNYQQVLPPAATSTTSEDLTMGMTLNRAEKEIQQYFDKQESSSLFLDYQQQHQSQSTANTTNKKTDLLFFDDLLHQLFRKNILSALSLYSRDVNNSASASGNASTLMNKRFLTWKNYSNEKQNWELIQKGLDVFFQRISVMDNAEQKQQMRLWYEAIMDLGSQFFS